MQTYSQGWEGAPYPPTFVTVDAVAVHSGHLLMVARGSQPGKGLWALPGGFVHGNERLMDAVPRTARGNSPQAAGSRPAWFGSIAKRLDRLVQ